MALTPITDEQEYTAKRKSTALHNNRKGENRSQHKNREREDACDGDDTREEERYEMINKSWFIFCFVSEVKL